MLRSAIFIRATGVSLLRRPFRAGRHVSSRAYVVYVRNGARVPGVGRRRKAFSQRERWWFGIWSSGLYCCPATARYRRPPSCIKHYRGVVLRSLEYIVLMSLSCAVSSARARITLLASNLMRLPRREILPLCCIRSSTLGRRSNEYDYECMRQRS